MQSHHFAWVAGLVHLVRLVLFSLLFIWRRDTIFCDDRLWAPPTACIGLASPSRWSLPSIRLKDGYSLPCVQQRRRTICVQFVESRVLCLKLCNFFSLPTTGILLPFIGSRLCCPSLISSLEASFFGKRSGKSTSSTSTHRRLFKPDGDKYLPRKSKPSFRTRDLDYSSSQPPQFSKRANSDAWVGTFGRNPFAAGCTGLFVPVQRRTTPRNSRHPVWSDRSSIYTMLAMWILRMYSAEEILSRFNGSYLFAKFSCLLPQSRQTYSN